MIFIQEQDTLTSHLLNVLTTTESNVYPLDSHLKMVPDRAGRYYGRTRLTVRATATTLPAKWVGSITLLF